MAIFDFIRLQFFYADNHQDLCDRKYCKMRRYIERIGSAALALLAAVSCEIVDDDIDKHTSPSDSSHVELNEIAEILAAVPLQHAHLKEVHKAVAASSLNGYDEEYTMKNLFEAPGTGVGDTWEGKVASKSDDEVYLRDLIEEYVRNPATKSAGKSLGPDEFLEALSASDIQIYWPFSEEWDGESLPVITFDPEDNSDANIGYRLVTNDDGSRHVEEVIVDEEMAGDVPVWVVNRNSDAGFTTLEMLRREDPNWGEGGGTVIVKPKSKTSGGTYRAMMLKDLTMHHNHDSWFAGGSEYWIKTGSLDDFTASTEAELRLYNPLVTDFLIVVKRSQVGIPQPFNAVLIPEWNPQMTHCAFMITEDDGGTRTEWKCTALVRIASKSYGVEINLPFNSRDDIVWRGHLTNRWIEANSNITSNFGDVSLTFELVEY